MSPKTNEETQEGTAKKAVRERIGVVLSNKMDKTVTVEVRRRYRHKKYHKYVGERVRFKAHDADNSCNIGDTVLLVETRPMSKDKRWRVAKIVERAVE